MAERELVKRLIDEISGLRSDIETLTEEVRLIRESSINAPPTTQNKSCNKSEIADRDTCDRLALFLHYYHMVRVEAKKQGIRVNTLSRNSLFASMYPRYCPNDYDRIMNPNDTSQTTLEKNFTGRAHLHFSIQMKNNTNLGPFFECALEEITPQYAAKAFIVDLDSCKNYAVYKPLVKIIKDVLK